MKKVDLKGFSVIVGRKINFPWVKIKTAEVSKKPLKLLSERGVRDQSASSLFQA